MNIAHGTQAARSRRARSASSRPGARRYPVLGFDPNGDRENNNQRVNH